LMACMAPKGGENQRLLLQLPACAAYHAFPAQQATT
jgi:hypothetical protein